MRKLIYGLGQKLTEFIRLFRNMILVGEGKYNLTDKFTACPMLLTFPHTFTIWM